ncbi:3'-5' exoribonuclease domain-containing protein [Escherichia coli]
MKWWLKQSREAQSAIMTDEIPLDDALLQLREFIDEILVNFLFRFGEMEPTSTTLICAVHTNGRDSLPVALLQRSRCTHNR